MKHIKRPSWVVWTTVVIFLCASVGFNGELTQFAESSPALKPRTVHVPIGGLEPLVADILWMRLIQFMGTAQEMSEAQRMARLYDKFDRITRLDPKFYMAYKYGVLSLFVQAPEKALNLVDRGLQFMSPQEHGWKFPFYGAFICYRYSEDEDRYERSLRYLRHIRQCEGAPAFVGRFKPMVLERNNQLGKALDVWLELYDNTEGPMDHHIVRNHLKRLAGEILKKDVSPDLNRRASRILEKMGGASPGSQREGQGE